MSYATLGYREGPRRETEHPSVENKATTWFIPRPKISKTGHDPRSRAANPNLLEQTTRLLPPCHPVLGDISSSNRSDGDTSRPRRVSSSVRSASNSAVKVEREKLHPRHSTEDVLPSASTRWDPGGQYVRNTRKHHSIIQSRAGVAANPPLRTLLISRTLPLTVHTPPSQLG